MLNEEAVKYKKLSGDNNPNTPISRIGGYLDGYERALAERKKGKWIGKHESGYCSHPDSITYRCSECGYSIYTVYGIGMPTSNFCPNCGADMRGES